MAFCAENGNQLIAKRPRVDNYHVAPTGGGGGAGGVINSMGGNGGSGFPVVMSQQYIEQQLNKKPAEPEKPNHILLFTIFNPHYPITCEVLNAICSPIGKVLRIVIFRKNGVQAMVEFESLEAAKTAKESLYGCDIYSGCCTLKIEFANKNDQDSLDYTNPNPGNQQGQSNSNHQRPVLLKEPVLVGGHHQQVNGNGLTHEISENGIQPTTLSSGHLHNKQSFRRNELGLSNIPNSCQGVATGQAPSFTSQGSVCMVYGLNPDKVNASRLFNLFCLFGNVTRIKFLKTKEGCAMVQLGDSAAVERSIANLNNVSFFGTKMQVGYSKQAFLADVQNPHLLSDGTTSFQDFMGNKNNRFMNPEMASKNRIQPPSKILHFFNTPPNMEEEDIEKVFTDQGVQQPTCVKLFPSKTERSSSGLIEFANQSDAIEGLIMCNHMPVNNPNGKFPFIMKLCFSSSRNIPNTTRP